MPKTFDVLPDALDYVIRELIPDHHRYIINAISRDDQESSRASTVQVVAEDMVYRNGRSGFTLYMPFDPASGELPQLIELMGTPMSEICDEFRLGDIPCFATRAGDDPILIEQMVRNALRHVHGNASLNGFSFEVFDEGQMDVRD